MKKRIFILTILIVSCSAALTAAQSFTTLYEFSGGADGSGPFAGVIQDSSGNLYGTTWRGGSFDEGTVFKLDTFGDETVLYSFCIQFDCPDGYQPLASLIRTGGNIYGTTSGGNVFKIDSSGNETVLHTFSEPEGCAPDQGLAMDRTGALYGTTSACGSGQPGYGTIFKIDSAGNFTLLHSFTGGPSDGGRPLHGNLTMDMSGNLYGVTVYGGLTNCDHQGCGVLYEMNKNGTFRILHSFAGGTTDGCAPTGSVRQDSRGNLYGTTTDCGSKRGGTIWKMDKHGKETILHNFAGCTPVAGVTRDSTGNFYGIALCGYYGHGALYKLSARGRFTLLHKFQGSHGGYGELPEGEVLRAPDGTLFGTTVDGGSCRGVPKVGCGTVWKETP